MENTDNSLIAAHCSGDTTAFAEIVRRYGDAVLGYLVRMTADREQAEDLFQETFRKVHEKAHTFRGNSFKSWLFTIATRAAIDSIRRSQRRRTVSLDAPVGCTDGHCDTAASMTAVDSADCDPPVRVMEAEQKQLVRAAVEELPARQRATLVLAYYEQLTYAEVAKTLGCSTGTVKMQMSRALRTLARKLPEFGGVGQQ